MNKYGERLVALNVERIRHWIGTGAHISKPSAELLGIAGLLPVHPKTLMTARRNRLAAAAAADNKEESEGREEASTS